MAFAKEKHVRYWRMCAQTLPGHYMSNDSSRMTLGFFIVSALDLLGALNAIPIEERQSWTSWIYRCQLPEGGFRGFTGTDLSGLRDQSNDYWDPANVPATFFALATLLILEDDLSRVKREQCLTWLPKLQRDDGSFGELLSENETIEGDRDLRQCCCAAGIAYILQDHRHTQPAFDERRLIQYIRSCQDQSGGFGVSPMREPHSGLSYCAIAALSFIQRLGGESSQDAIRHVPDQDQCTKWFLERQTNFIDDEVEGEDEDGGDIETVQANLSMGQSVASNVARLLPDIREAGFNGRDGKIADTCYAFWNTGALAILKQEGLADSDALKQYLLEVTQHRVGGFGKGRGDPPDVLHSYLGLATLALFDQAEVQALDPTMCMSITSAERLRNVSWKRYG